MENQIFFTIENGHLNIVKGGFAVFFRYIKPVMLKCVPDMPKTYHDAKQIRHLKILISPF